MYFICLNVQLVMGLSSTLIQKTKLNLRQKKFNIILIKDMFDYIHIYLEIYSDYTGWFRILEYYLLVTSTLTFEFFESSN